jgi:DNA-binding NarL/FixJ family response regulator
MLDLPPCRTMRARVLLVDDHRGFRERARVLLEAEGFDVVGEAADGRSGLAAAARLHPDVALVDVQLADLDGFAVAAAMRSAGTAARIVLISGREAEDFGVRLDGSAADGFIAKADLCGERLTEVIA